ncbi:hypothetical protein AC1031_012357 [Aphanomyces cochlioides]|nr:hypothetical protein AC1031_012357 [Aphanomyces cochlioides]
MSLKSKAKRLTRKELESRLAQYESTAVNQATSNTSCVKQEDIIPEKKVVWTEDMVRILLELWLHRYAAAFQATQSNQQLSVLWKKIALSLNLACSATIPAQSAKSKYHSLKAEYTKIHIQEQSTGNNVDENGLGHKEFGSSTDLDETIGDETVDIIEQTNTKRLKSEETTSKRGRRVSQTSVADGLAALGQTLAKGLVDAAIATPTQQDEKLDVILNAFQESKRVQDALLENISTSNAIQAELLAFLKQNSGK